MIAARMEGIKKRQQKTAFLVSILVSLFRSRLVTPITTS